LVTRPSAPSEESAARRGNRAPRCTPRLPRASVLVQRFRGDSIGPNSVQVLPVQPLPFPAGLCGSSLSPSPPGLKPAALLSASYRAPRSLASVCQPHPPALGECTSPGVPSPTALDDSGCPYVPGVPPPGTVRPQGFPPSRRLASPKTMRASSRLTSDEPCGPPTRARPLRSWGSTGPPPLAQTFRLEGRATAPGFPLQGFLLPRDEPVLAGSPLSHFASPEATPFSGAPHG